MKARAWTLEHVFQYSSMNDIISRLSESSYTSKTTICTSPFPGCHQGFDDIVEEACRRTTRDFDGCAWIAWIGASRSARMTMKTTGVTTTQLTDAGTWYAGFATAVPLGITARWDDQIEEAGPEAIEKRAPWESRDQEGSIRAGGGERIGSAEDKGGPRQDRVWR